MTSHCILASLLLALCASQAVAGDEMSSAVRFELAEAKPLVAADGPVKTTTTVEKVRGLQYAGVRIGDLNGDGLPDLMTGDVFGNLRVYPGQVAGGAHPFSAPMIVRLASQEPAKIHNW